MRNKTPQPKWEIDLEKLPQTKMTTKEFIRQLLSQSQEQIKLTNQEHQTEEGYCCACGYDIAGFEERLKEAKTETLEEVEKEIHILIAQEIIISQKEGTPTSRLTSLAVKLASLVAGLKK